jgi:DNA-directed RNA polymerase I, II, and III subunit RPABC2
MPPKGKKKTKITNQTNQEADEESAQVDQETQEDELPQLEFISDSTKERYEYRPVLRTEIVYRKPEDRVTSEVMTKFELCEIISIRAKQLEQGKTVFTDVGDLTDPLAIAKKEIVDKKCPLSIVRMITDRIAEKWQVNEMAIPYDAL